ncbi:EAL domain-containing protein [Candidatus Woesearchaeota archaeon]|nr:MAG: EAL domain-containing protein [Candidatus Woesearchaeota archaeon]
MPKKSSLETLVDSLANGSVLRDLFNFTRHFSRSSMEEMRAHLDFSDLQSFYRLATHIIEQSHDIIELVDLKRQEFVYVNPQFTSVFGYEQHEVIGKSPAQLLRSGEHPEEFYQEFYETIRKGETWSAEVTSRTKSGELVTLETLASSIRTQGEVTHYVVIKHDISERKRHEATKRQSQKELAMLANTHPLTKLPNKRMFTQSLEHTIKKSERTGESFSVFFLDLDNFKTVNDAYGHQEGDRFLIEISKRLERQLQNEELVAHVGGDEYALISKLSDRNDLLEVGKLILRTVEQPVEGINVQVTSSIGVAVYPRDAKTSEELMRCADLAQYHVKESGKRGIEIFNEDLRRKLHAEQESKDLALLALREPERIVPLYHPIIDRDGIVQGAEALMTIRDKNGKIRRAAEFINTASKMREFSHLNWFMYHQVLQDLDSLAKRGIYSRMSVNMPKRMIADPAFVEEIESYRKGTAVRPSQIVLELTERGYDHSREELPKNLERLREQGYCVALDDFGKGNNNLDSLLLPVDYIKIDHEVTKNILVDEQSLKKVQLILTASTLFDYPLIVEGVRSEEMLIQLRGLGVQYFQGNYISRPVQLSTYRKKAGRRIVEFNA